MSKKGEAFWRRVREAYERGEGSQMELAARFGVNRQTIQTHAKAEGWIKGGRKAPPAPDMREVTERLSEAAMREIGRLEEEETDVKTIRDLTALVKELNQLMKSAAGEGGESTVRVQWDEEAERWSQ